MTNQESYLLQLIEKVEQLERSLNKIENIEKRQLQLIDKLKKIGPLFDSFIKSSAQTVGYMENSYNSFNVMLKSLPKNIPRPIVLEIKKGSFLEISKSLLVLFTLCSILLVGSNWIQFQYFDSYNRAWELVKEKQSEAWKDHMTKKLKEVRNQSLWEKITK